MATGIQSKVSSDIAADTISADSLSFTGLVCIQDQCSKPQIGHVLPLPPAKQDPEFEFGHATQGSTAGTGCPNKGAPADLLFSNGQLLPQAIPSHSNPSKVLVHVSTRDLLPPTRGSSSIHSRRSSDSELGFNKAAKKPNNEVRNQAIKDRSKGNRYFGPKIFKSFVAPCRGCRAIEPSGPSPSIKVQTLQQETAKLH